MLQYVIYKTSRQKKPFLYFGTWFSLNTIGLVSHVILYLHIHSKLLIEPRMC